MKIKTMIFAITAGVMMLASISVSAATIESDDGVLTIETPDENWVKTPDPNYDFVVSDGKSSITVNHLANGEQLPEVQVADANYKGIMQTYVSTPNEVFVVKGLAAEQADLETLMKTIGTLKVLKFDTKTAVATSNAAVPTDFGLRAINADYYCTGTEVSVRASCSVDSSKIGELDKGEKISVRGMLTKDGQDYGWYQVDYKGTVAYVNAAYLSPDAPAGGSNSGSSNNTNTSSPTVSSSTPSSSAYAPSTGMVQCPDCGGWFEEGVIFRNHICPGKNYDSGSDSGSVSSDSNDTMLVYSNGSGRPVNLTGSNGVYYDGEGNEYYVDGNGNITDNQGASYSSERTENAPTTDVIGLESDGSGRPVAVMQGEDGNYVDTSGNIYYQNDEGTFTDEDGATYGVTQNDEY